MIPTERLPLLIGSRDKKKKDSLPIQIPWCDTHFVQFKEEKLIQLGLFISGEEQKFRLSQRFWPPTGYVAT